MSGIFISEEITFSMSSDSEESFEDPDLEEITLQMYGQFDPYRYAIV